MEILLLSQRVNTRKMTMKCLKNSRVLYILQCAINNEIFNHVCSCETAKDLWEKLTLIYEETSEENLDSSKRENMLFATQMMETRLLIFV